MDFLLQLQTLSDWGMLILRIAIGSIFIAHGYGKFSSWKPLPPEHKPNAMHAIMKLLSLAEPLGGAAVMVGIFLQPAAIGLSLVMIGALYFKIIVWKKKFTESGGWEFDLLILSALIFLILSGGGLLSFDHTLFGF